MRQCLFGLPYIDREQHEPDFIKYMSNYTSSRYPDKKFLVIINEQGDESLAFSRSHVRSTPVTYSTETIIHLRVRERQVQIFQTGKHCLNNKINSNH